MRLSTIMNRKNTQSTNMAKTAFFIMILSILGRGLGLVRESILAARFGASLETDAYKIAFTIPTIILITLSSSISTTLIPVYTDYIKYKSKKECKYYINNLINIIGLISIAITVFGLAFAPYIIKLLAPGFSGEGFDLTIKLSIIMMPSILFYALSNISEGLLQANKIFIVTAFTAIPFNLFIISGIVLPKNSNIEIVSIGSLLAVAFQFIVMIPYMRKTGYRYNMVINFRDEGLKKTFRLMIPVLISSSFSQASVFIIRMLASSLPEGSISALDYAEKANNIIFNIVIIPVIMIIYPKLSYLQDNVVKFCKTFMRTIKGIIYIAFPTAAILFVYRVPITQLLYERGLFRAENTLSTSIALGCLSIGIPGICTYTLLVKTFYSMKNTRTPMITDIFVVLANIILSLILIRPFGIGGLALSMSIASTAGCILLFIGLKKIIPIINFSSIEAALAKASASSIISVLSMLFLSKIFRRLLFLNDNFIHQMANLLILVSSSLIIYICFLALFKTEELKFIKDYFLKIKRKIYCTIHNFIVR